MVTALDAFTLYYEEGMPSAKRMDVLKLRLARRHLQERRSAAVLFGIALLSIK